MVITKLASSNNLSSLLILARVDNIEEYLLLCIMIFFIIQSIFFQYSTSMVINDIGLYFVDFFRNDNFDNVLNWQTSRRAT